MMGASKAILQQTRQVNGGKGVLRLDERTIAISKSSNGTALCHHYSRVSGLLSSSDFSHCSNSYYGLEDHVMIATFPKAWIGKAQLRISR